MVTRRSGLAAGLGSLASAACAPLATLTGRVDPGAACAQAGWLAPPGCWHAVRAAGSGGFPPDLAQRDLPAWAPGRFPLGLQPVVAFDDTLWMISRSRAYISADGFEWHERVKADWGERIYHATVFFNGRLWMCGGMDYASRRFLNDIWSSADGAEWRQVGQAPWSPRGGHAMRVWRGRLWLLGGASHARPDRSTDGALHDVWVSDDGSTWTEITAAAPWPARDAAGAAVLGDALFIVGGGGHADVWRSIDGREWTAVATDAAFGRRLGHSVLAFDGRIWLFGGWIGRSTHALNDVWFSNDGARWQRQARHAPWGPRSAISVVFRDRIWIYSGKHTGGDDSWSGDVWQMSATTTRAP